MYLFTCILCCLFYVELKTVYFWMMAECVLIMYFGGYEDLRWELSLTVVPFYYSPHLMLVHWNSGCSNSLAYLFFRESPLTKDCTRNLLNTYLQHFKCILPLQSEHSEDFKFLCVSWKLRNRKVHHILVLYPFSSHSNFVFGSSHSMLSFTCFGRASGNLWLCWWPTEEINVWENHWHDRLATKFMLLE